MKNLSSLCLGAALLLAVPRSHVLAADAPKETAEQKAARHAAELKEAEAKINALAKEFPLLTGPGWEENYGKFRAELKRLQSDPTFPRQPVLAKPAPGKVPPAPKTLAQFQQERRDAVLALMRLQGDKVLAKHPELKDYIGQQFQWHQRLFGLQDQYLDNPKVRQLVQNRLAVVAVSASP